jgi:hypothetical protein
MITDLSTEALQFYEDHPVDFCRDLIDNVDFDDWQIEAFDNLVKDHFVAIKAGSGVGKTVWLSLAMLWFLATKPFSKVPCTAPSQHQLSDLLWGEAHKWIGRSNYLAELLDWTQTKIAVKKYGPEWYAVARTARVATGGTVAEGLQGFHAEENLLYIGDEASGIPDEIFPALEGALTGKGAYVILTANPTRLTGYFHSVFNDIRMRGMYKLMTVSCYDSKFVSERYLKMMEIRYGKNHPIYQIKVLGEFPTADVNLLFQPEDIEAFKNHDPIDMRGVRMPFEMGLDIGRSINKSIMCIRRGPVILEYIEKELTGTVADTVEVTQWAVEIIQAYGPESVKVDAIGIGVGVYDNLVRLYPKVVKPVIGNAVPADDKKRFYANLRAQGYWELRNLLPSLYCKKIPDKLIEEVSDIRYLLRNGKILIESKKDMKESPDYTDATMYAFLDSELCIGGVDFASPNFGLEMNDELQKTCGWTAFGKASQPPSISKWDVLHG